MGTNDGLMKCWMPLGHGDAYTWAIGYLKASPQAAVREAVREALLRASEQGHILPDHAKYWLSELEVVDEQAAGDSPF